LEAEKNYSFPIKDGKISEIVTYHGIGNRRKYLPKNAPVTISELIPAKVAAAFVANFAPVSP